MSAECGYCERDTRGPHAKDCKRPTRETRIAKAERAVIRAAVWMVRQWKLETVGGPRTPRTALGRAVDRLEKALGKR